MHYLLPLLNLLKDGQFHSGEHLSMQLGLTRASIWKQIHKIKQLGVPVDAITGKGYCIPGGIDLLDFDFIRSALTAFFDVELIGLFTVKSTNDYLLEFIKKHPSQKPIVVLSEMQTAGRGRQGKYWHSPFAKNILLSCYWSFSCDFHHLAGLSLVLAIACVQALEKLGIEDLQIKWPNDLYAKGRKLGGILIETQREGEGLIQAVIGIGINYYTMQDEHLIDQQVISVEQLMNNHLPSRNQSIVTLVRFLTTHLEQFTHMGFKTFLSNWKQYDMLAKKKVEIERNAKKIQGMAIGINELGHLQLDINGELISIDSGYDRLSIIDN